MKCVVTRVMICEDDPLQSIDLAAAVEDAGGAVCGCFRSSAEALAAAKRILPDVALVDLTLADGETGVELALELSKSGCRIIILSGNSSSHPNLGRIAHSFISKPFQREIIGELMRPRAVAVG